VTIQLADGNGQPYGDEAVDLVVDYTTQALAPAPSWCPAAREESAAAWTAIPASATGGEVVLVWDALADAGAGSCGLQSIDADLDGEDGSDLPRLAYAAEVALRISPVDDGGLVGESVETDPFAVGNAPPTAAIKNGQEQELSGLVPIEFSVSDAALDSADIELQFRADGDTTWREPHIVQGTLVGLQPAEERFHVVAWSSTTQEPYPAPTGIGDRCVAVDVRIRARDIPSSNETHYSPWSDPPTRFANVCNQHRPWLEQLTVPETLWQRGAGPLQIGYRAVDEESDPVDVRFEYSLGRAGDWTRCREYHSSSSEGRYDLASRPPGSGDSHGVEHTFVWDTAAIHFGSPPDRVRLRGFISDGKPDNSPTETSISIAAPVGPRGTVPFGPEVAYAAPSTRTVVTGNFDTDNIQDLAVGGIGGSYAFFSGLADGTFADAISTTAVATAAVTASVAADLDGNGSAEVISALRYGGALTVVGFDPGWTVIDEVAVDRPAGLAVADFTEDNRLDVVVVQTGLDAASLLVFEDSATWLALSHSVATCPAPPSVAICPAPPSIAAGDFTGDGFSDFVVSCPDTDEVELHPGLGDGSFGEAQSIAVGSFPAALVAGDLDQDGNTDIVVANWGDSTVTALLGQSGGGFAPTITRPTRTLPVALHIADVNADGNNDLLLVNRDDGTIGVMVRHGTRLGVDAVIPFSSGPADLAIGDFDNDGRPDLATVSRQALADDVTVRLAAPHGDLGDGGFAVTTVGGGAANHQLAAADWNDDGILDLGITRPGIEDLLLARGDGELAAGNATFVPNVSRSLFGPASALAMADFTADGLFDLAISSELQGLSGLPDGPSLLVFVADQVGDVGVASMSRGNAVSFASAAAAATSLVAGDFNTDLHLDLVAAFPDDNTVVFLPGQGNGGFGAPVPMSTTLVARAPTVVAAADVNADGDLDLLVGAAGVCQLAPRADSCVRVFHGDGAGAFASAAVVGLDGDPPSALAIGDLNDDGALDLVVTTRGATGSVIPVFGTVDGDGSPDGGFVVGTAVRDAAWAPTDVSLADLTGDGAVDLVVGVNPRTNGGVSEVVILRNDALDGLGSGSLSLATRVPVEWPMAQLLLLDVNRSGLVDIITTNLEGDDLTLLAGQNDNIYEHSEVTFSLSDSLASAEAPAIIAAPTQIPSGNDRLGNPIEATGMSIKLARIVPGTPAIDLLAGARAFGLGRERRLAPLTRAFIVSGAVRFLRIRSEAIPDADGCGDRLRVELRHGDRRHPNDPEDVSRSGLDVDASPPSGYLVPIPLIAGRSADDVSNAASLRLFRLRFALARAHQVAADSIDFSGEEAARYLPRVAFNLRGDCRDVFKETPIWTEIARAPENDITQGSGERFVVDLANQRVLLFVDKLGVFQAFLDLTP
jgi:hypothetical protein